MALKKSWSFCFLNSSSFFLQQHLQQLWPRQQDRWFSVARMVLKVRQAVAQIPRPSRMQPLLVLGLMQQSMSRKKNASTAFQNSLSQDTAYQLATKNTFSTWYFFLPVLLTPLVPQLTSSMLQKAQMTMTWEQQPCQTRQLMESTASLHTNLGCVNRCMKTMSTQHPTFRQVMMNTHIDSKSLMTAFMSILWWVPGSFPPMYTQMTFQITRPSITKVNSVNTREAFQACFVQMTPMRLPPTHTNTVRQYNSPVMFAMYQIQSSLADCFTVVHRVKKKKVGVKYPFRNDSFASSIQSGRVKYVRQQLWLDSITLKQQFRSTYSNAKWLLLIHRRRCFINYVQAFSTSYSVFIGSVRAIALGMYFRIQFFSCWQQIPRLRIRSSAKYILASLQSLSSTLGSRIILKYFLSSKFCSNFSLCTKASQRQADHAPGSTCKKPVKLSQFLSQKWAIIYSNSWAFSTDAKASRKQFFFLCFSDPSSSETKLLSTLISPVTPPIFLSWKAVIRLAMPLGSGSVPTSSSTQNSGLMCRQNPSKNQRCDDSFVPLMCLKQVISLSFTGSSGLGLHIFWYTSDKFFSIEGGKSWFLTTNSPIRFLLKLSISSRTTLILSTRWHLSLPSLMSSSRQNSTTDLSPLEKVLVTLSSTSLRMPSWRTTTAMSSGSIPSSWRAGSPAQMPLRVVSSAILLSLNMHTQTRILMPRLPKPSVLRISPSRYSSLSDSSKLAMDVFSGASSWMICLQLFAQIRFLNFVRGARPSAMIEPLQNRGQEYTVRVGKLQYCGGGAYIRFTAGSCGIILANYIIQTLPISRNYGNTLCRFHPSPSYNGTYTCGLVGQYLKMEPSRMRSIEESSESSLENSRPTREPKNYEKYLQRKRELRKADEIVKRMEDNLRKYSRDESGSEEEAHIEQRMRERIDKQERDLAIERNKNAQLQKTLDRLRQQVATQGRQTQDSQALKSALQKRTDECIQLRSKMQKVLARNVQLEEALKYQLSLVCQLPSN